MKKITDSQLLLLLAVYLMAGDDALEYEADELGISLSDAKEILNLKFKSLKKSDYQFYSYVEPETKTSVFTKKLEDAIKKGWYYAFGHIPNDEETILIISKDKIIGSTLLNKEVIDDLASRFSNDM